MNPWEELSSYSVTPAASLLSKCVATGVLSQADLDGAVSKEPHVFSAHLQEAQQLISMKQKLDEMNLETELLRLEKESADVTHKFYLSQKFTALQQCTSHLQDILREQASLRQRLMKPLCQTNLPIEADLHRYVVEVIKMIVDFIGSLEMSMNTVRTIPTMDDSMNTLNNGLAQLLAQVAEMEKLSKQILRRTQQGSLTNDTTSTSEQSQTQGHSARLR